MTEQKYVVCLDTMGQDRALTEDQVGFSIQIVKEYAHNWHDSEVAFLQKDIVEKVEGLKKDRDYMENEGPNIAGDEEKFIDDMLAMREDLETDEQRDKETKFYKFRFNTTQLTALTTEPEVTEEDEKSRESKPATSKDKGKQPPNPKDAKAAPAKDAKAAQPPPAKKKEAVVEKDKEEADGEGDFEHRQLAEPRLDEASRKWRDEIVKLKNAKVIRFPRVLQSIMYLLQISREEICEVKTNKLWWKKAKNIISDDFFMKIFKYDPIGPKEGEYKPYQKLNFIKKMIEDIDVEAVESYSFAIGRILQWVKLAMEVRKEDVIKRILNNRRLKAEREAAIQQEEDRKKERQAFYEEEKAKWEEEMVSKLLKLYEI